MKRVFIVHGWEGNPENAWFPWLKKELEAHGFEVHAPSMPHPDTPTIEDWVAHLAKEVGATDEQTYFVGHSIGGPAILHYLASLPEGTRVGGVVFVAGWLTLKGLETREEKDIAEPWVAAHIDVEKVKRVSSGFAAIFSDDDPFVSAEDNSGRFQKDLGAKVLIEHAKGHFDDDAGITELPSARDALLTLAGEAR